MNGIQQAVSFAENHAAWIGGAAGFSVFLLIGSLILTPWLLSRLPADYFHNPDHRPLESLAHRPFLRIVLLLIKNLVGLLLLLAGLSMLFLPGQGLLTILMALVLLDFPKKFALKRSLIERPRISAGINQLRKRHNKPPFQP